MYIQSLLAPIVHGFLEHSEIVFFSMSSSTEDIDIWRRFFCPPRASQVDYFMLLAFDPKQECIPSSSQTKAKDDSLCSQTTANSPAGTRAACVTRFFREEHQERVATLMVYTASIPNFR
jgi:hypothetical protein